jgi:hypothetical protein
MKIWMLRFFPQPVEVYVHFNTKKGWWKSTPIETIPAKTSRTFDFRNDPKELECFFIRIGKEGKLIPIKDQGFCFYEIATEKAILKKKAFEERISSFVEKNSVESGFQEPFLAHST